MTYAHRISCITPPFILTRLLDSDNVDIRQAALSTLVSTAHLRGERSVRGLIAGALASPSDGRRSVYDCRHSTFLPFATLVRSEDDAAVSDASANRAFDGFGATRSFYAEVFQRNSIDDRGMRLEGYVHRGRRYNNAFWDGQEMVFGDGDGQVFTDFTGSLDVIAHELTHGVTEHTAGLEYHGQSGALNESISDAFGSMVKQWSLGQTADQADWLIGPEVFTPHIDADALRSMKAPGTAFDNKLFGKDPQPDHMSRYVDAPDTDEGDWGGVHTNSGIPNKAFYLVAIGIGGKSWEAPGHIWYESLKASTSKAQFQDFADTTYRKAEQLYGTDSREQQAVKAAWDGVGIQVTTTPTLAR
ncbi:peptidase M4 [Actinoplanes sp. SE50]|uniref:M4 family metallopeptidase n=1 Tax=unclassified Actinoplanes TaxID=2626549 RepID=UPI00023EC0AB|nr:MULTISPECIES: M4 family metallopeptidase [unclassified Actinoplanes]AEV83535.1 peptidase M4 thermolysin [Actinoplanes sp. SE50/110]ATO82321.1 peptidase M4 [Actinoplanes sp. SE50]SLL99728.1 peptidase M4 [Actinoplanes sp. SE50/110]